MQNDWLCKINLPIEESNAIYSDVINCWVMAVFPTPGAPSATILKYEEFGSPSITGAGANRGVADKWGLTLGVRPRGGLSLPSPPHRAPFLRNESPLLTTPLDVVLNERTLRRFASGFPRETSSYDTDRRSGELPGGWESRSWGLFTRFLYFSTFCLNSPGSLKEPPLITPGVGGRSPFEDSSPRVPLCSLTLLDLEWDPPLKSVGSKRRGVVCSIPEPVLE